MPFEALVDTAGLCSTWEGETHQTVPALVPLGFYLGAGLKYSWEIGTVSFFLSFHLFLKSLSFVVVYSESMQAPGQNVMCFFPAPLEKAVHFLGGLPAFSGHL
jgi:hypothetical protein